MIGTGVAAVQTRVAEIATLFAPAPAAVETTSEGFGTAFAEALDGSSWDGSTGAWPLAVGPTLLAGTARGAAGAAVTVAGPVTGQDLVDAARTYLGVPYVWGGESLSEGGLDCSGLVQRSFADLGVTDVPRVARDQATLGTPVASLADALPGDLVVFGGGTHIGIYAGDGKMIDAPQPGKVVQLRDVYETPTAIRRVLPATAAEAVGPTGAAGSGVDDDLAAQQAFAAALLSGVAA